MYCPKLESSELQGGLGGTEACGSVCLHAATSADANAQAEQFLMRNPRRCYPGADLAKLTDPL